MKRYHTAIGSFPEEVKAAFHIQGPQNEDQIAKEIRDLLDRSGITQVDIRYNHGLGDRIEVYRKLPEDSTAAG